MSLMDAIETQISGGRIAEFASASGKTQDQVRAATAVALPAVLASLSNLVLDAPSLDLLLKAIRERQVESDEGSTPPEGVDVLGPLLGANLGGLIGVLSRATGFDEPTVRSLLGFLGPIVLTTVGDRLRAEGAVDAERLIHVFTADKPKIAQALPEGVSLADLPSIPGVPTTAPEPAQAGPEMPSWLLPALAVALIAASVWLLIKQPPEAPSILEPKAPATPRKVDETPPAPPIEPSPRPSAS